VTGYPSYIGGGGLQVLPVFQGPMKYPGPAYKATQDKFTEKILYNPHTAIRREAQRDLGKLNGRAVRHAAGEQWWGPIEKKDPRFQAQKPLLDGGEGKSLDKTIVNKIETVPSGLPKDSNLGREQRQTIEDPPMEPKVEFTGLMPPTLDSTGGYVTGADKAEHRIDNKRRRKANLATQQPHTQWTQSRGNRGQKQRCKRQWIEDLTNRHYQTRQ